MPSSKERFSRYRDFRCYENGSAISAKKNDMHRVFSRANTSILITPCRISNDNLTIILITLVEPSLFLSLNNILISAIVKMKFKNSVF